MHLMPRLRFLRLSEEGSAMPLNTRGLFGRIRRAARPSLAGRGAPGRGRFARVGAIGAVVPLLGGLAVPSMLTSGAAQPAAGLHGHAEVPVPVRELTPGRPRVKIPVMRSAPQTAVTWPAAGAATVALPAQGTAAVVRGAVALARASAGSARAGSLPVEVGPPDSAAAVAAAARLDGQPPASVRVTIASHAAALKAGVSGVIFTLARADGSAVADPVHVSLDYASFASADWGYAGRLRLVELPACALTTPQVAACRRETSVQSYNDVQTSAIGGDVTLPAHPAGTSGQTAVVQAAAVQTATAAAETGATVLAATEGSSGSSGNFGAEPLTGSANWSAGGNSGAFTYSYSLGMPPVPGGLEPLVSFDYDSQSVDGLTSSTNNQASWIGDGWSYDPGYIERDYQTCASNKSLPAADQTGDLCWNASADVTTLVLNGTSTTLVDDPTNGWTAEADNGEKVTYETGTGANGTHDDDYWVVTDTDGTSYYFGRSELPGYASGDATTNSALTVPVYGPVSGDPCYNATFSKAACPQAWRWELDYVTDAKGDAIAYFYNTETNYYAADNGTKATASYIQAAALKDIEYGFRAGSVYSTSATPAAEVNFTAPQTRTDIPTSTSNGNTDLACASGATCSVTSPTFWSKYQLTTVATEALDGTTLKPVDSWALGQTYPATDSTTSPSMWLSSIQRTGDDGSTTIKLPAVTFSSPEAFANRVNLTDGYDPLTRYRLEDITTETGQDIVVDYSAASCPSTRPADDDNTSLCFPSWWTPSNGVSFEDWFNKYVVTSVTEEDDYTQDAQPAVTTSYCYGSQSSCLSGGAWHYDDDTLVRSDQRTWDQWRGFQYVWTTVGTSPETETEDQYFRGMTGDYQDGNPLTSATLTSQVGGVQQPDDDQYAGMDFEHTVYDGDGGAMLTDTVTTPWSEETGSQSQPSPLPALTAYLTGQDKVQTFTALASGGNRESDTAYGYDSDGLVIWESQAPDALVDGTQSAAEAAEDTCTQTNYAQNTTTNLVDLPSEVVVTNLAPTSCVSAYSPSSPPTSGELISDTRLYYDSSTTLGSAPAQGNLTETTEATSYLNSTEEFTTESQDTYDEYGRVEDATNADGATTVTAYTPATGAEPTSIAVTTPATANAPSGLLTTTTFDPLREVPLSVTDPDTSVVTSKTYDALGRITAEYLPTASEAAGADPSYAYTYDVSNSGPSVVTTETIEPNGTSALPSETFYDSDGQQIETQTETALGNMDVTMSFYDSHGRKELDFNSFYASGTPTTPPTFVSANNNAVPYQTGYDYDGAGRLTQRVTYSDGIQQYETATSYGGDWTTTTPPQGGTPETTYTNGEGETTYLYQYDASTAPASPPAPGSGTSAGNYDQTSYGYTDAGELQTITDEAGNTWSYSYDLAGDQLTAKTPDAGTTTSTYDNDGNLLSATDSDGTVSYAYDADGRKTAEYAAPVASQSTSNEVAAWVYDTLAKGMPTSSTAYVGGTSGTAYAETSFGYTSAGESKGMYLKIASGPLAGTYYTEDYYDNAGDLDEYIDSANAGLPQETVDLGYNDLAEPTSVTSTLGTYVSDLSYTELDQPYEYAFGPTNDPAWLYDASYTYQGQLQEAQTVVGPTSTDSSDATVDDQNYSYDNNGDITADADTPSGGAAQVQCFQYGNLDRLSTAWSQGSAGCSSGPSQSAEAGAAAPYWDSYQYNGENDLTGQTSTPASGPATTYDNSFPATSGNDGPHAIAEQQTQVSGATTGTTTYGYDDAGDTTSITANGATDSLNWDGAGQVPGQLAAATNSSGTVASYVYDASGNLLLQTDGTTTTLYLPDEQITANTGSSPATLSGTRYYSLGGQSVAARTSAGMIYYLTGNQQGTDTVAINASNLAVSTRYYDPYGNQIGTAGSWPGTRGFVGGTADPATGLTNLGAREYNSGTDSFTSTDPVLNPYDPNDLDPYDYAEDNPSTLSDPTGMMAGGNGTPPNPCGVDASSSCDPTGGGGPNPSGSGSTGSNGNGNSTSSGTGYTGLGPGVEVGNGDPKSTALRTAYNSFLHFNGYGSSGITNAAQNDAVWYQICQQNAGLCPSSMYLTLLRAFLPGGTPTTVLGGGVFFIGQGGGGQGGGGGDSADEAEWRSLADPESMVGATLDQVRALVPEGWTELPLSKGSLSGVRFLSPGQGKLGMVRYVEGAPGAGAGQAAEAIHDGGDYINVKIGGLKYWAAAEGNAAIANPDVPSVVIDSMGSTGPVSLGDGIDFGAPGE